MRVFIMAAGIGSRLSRDAQHEPKCLLPIGGRPMVAWMIDRLERNGLNDITLVTGYKRESVISALGDRVRYRHNPFFRVTNSIASLWFARDLLAGGALLLNGDLFFEDRLLDVVLSEQRSPVLFSDSSRKLVADYKFVCDGERIVGYGKDIPPERADAEYVGIGKVSSADMPAFRTRLERLVDTEQHGKWWEDVLYTFVAEGKPVYHRDLSGIFWAEADFVEDYERIQSWVAAHPHVR